MMARDKSHAFVAWVLDKSEASADRGFCAKLRKAESEATEHQAWDILASWVDLENPWERKSYGLIGASLSRLKSRQDGTQGMGSALQALFRKRGVSGDIETSAEAKRLRRLLSCRDQAELMEAIRPLLRYLVSQEISLSHAQLLDEVLFFGLDGSREKTRLRWAKDFYRRERKEEASS